MGKLSHVVAFLPDGRKIEGILDRYGRLHHTDEGEEDCDVLSIYGKLVIPGFTHRDNLSLSDIDKINEAIKLVKLKYVTEDMTFESLHPSEHCPFQGFDYPHEGAWELPYEEAVAMMYPHLRMG